MRHPFRRLQWRLLHSLPARDIVVETANGLLTVRNKDWLVGKTLYVERAFESAEVDEIVAALRGRGWLEPERPIVADVGANLGMIAIAMLLRGYFREALAFEPDTDNFRLLAANARRNGLAERLTAIPMALSSAAGEARLRLSPDNSGDHRLEATSAGPGFFHEERRPAVPVATTTLDAWLATAAVDPGRIGLIWADVQGHEAHALAGARSCLRRRIPTVVEVWPYAMERSGAGVRQFFELVREFFVAYIPWSLGEREPRPIAALESLLASLAGPRAMTQIVLLPR